MAETFKGYYLPPSLADVEQRLEMDELSLGDARVLVPRLKPQDAFAIASTLHANRANVASIQLPAIAEAYDRAINSWKDHARPEKQAVLKYLPALAGQSPEMIERFLFGTLYRIDRRAIEGYMALRLDDKAFKQFQQLESTGTLLKGYAGMLGRMRIKVNTTSPQDISLVTFLTPPGVPGYYECLGMLWGIIARASMVIQADPGQPLFSPLFARSVAAASPEIGETFAVLPWAGADQAVEDAFIRQSNAVSVMGDEAEVKAIEKRMNHINHTEGPRLKGCYHSGMYGFELIGKEFATREVARLAALDGTGFEGHTCASPACGFFVESGGPLSPEGFAEAVAEEAGRLSQAIPQPPARRAAREKRMAEITADPEGGRRIITTAGLDYAIIYEPKASLKPLGQDRIFRVMPVDRFDEVIAQLKPWASTLHTAGIAVPDSRVTDLAERLGKAGISSIRVTGTMTQPGLGEAWDGNLPVLEYYLPDSVHWVSINAISVEREIRQLTRQK